MYWEKTGKENTDATLDIALKTAKELNIKHIIVASNSGTSAYALLEKTQKLEEKEGKEEKLELVCVTHMYGFREEGKNELKDEKRKFLQENGIKILTTTHLFRGVDAALRKTWKGIYPAGIIAQTLRMWGEGTKVAVEIAIMALDAGLIPYKEKVISIGGTGHGADTAIVIIPAHSTSIFDSIICQEICRPIVFNK